MRTAALILVVLGILVLPLRAGAEPLSEEFTYSNSQAGAGDHLMPVSNGLETRAVARGELGAITTGNRAAGIALVLAGGIFVAAVFGGWLKTRERPLPS
jgi:hypothetical protein